MRLLLAAFAARGRAPRPAAAAAATALPCQSGWPASDRACKARAALWPAGALLSPAATAARSSLARAPAADCSAVARVRCRHSRHPPPPTLLPPPSLLFLQGPGAAAFRWHKRDKHQRQQLGGDDGGGGGSSEEGSLFVEPLRWMGEGGGADSVVGGAVQGKLYCPK